MFLCWQRVQGELQKVKDEKSELQGQFEKASSKLSAAEEEVRTVKKEGKISTVSLLIPRKRLSSFILRFPYKTPPPLSRLCLLCLDVLVPHGLSIVALNLNDADVETTEFDRRTDSRAG